MAAKTVKASRLARKLHAEGMTLEGIAVELFKKGHTGHHGKQYGTSSISRLLNHNVTTKRKTKTMNNVVKGNVGVGVKNDLKIKTAKGILNSNGLGVNDRLELVGLVLGL
jgi:hypothetical protein